MKALTLISTAAELTKAIDSIGKRGAKLDADIQLAGLSCLDQIEKHGDVTLFNRLYHAMPKGARRNALAAWGLQFGKLAVNTADNKKELPFAYNKQGATDLAGAAEQAWYTFKPEKAVADEFDFASRLQALLKQAAKAAEEGKAVKGAEELLKVQAALAGGVALPDAVTGADELEEAV